MNRTSDVFATAATRPGQQHGFVRACDAAGLIDDRLHLRTGGNDTIVATTAGRLSHVPHSTRSAIESRSSRCGGFDAGRAER